MEITLMAVLLMALFGYIALGMDDEKRRKASASATPIQISAGVEIQMWGDSLPTRRSLPWAENAGA